MQNPIILIVDDAPENIDVLRAALKDNYAVRPAINGATALKIANANPKPALILLDIMMPGMDGYEVMRRLQASEATRDIPVIFVTAISDMEGELKGLELGAVDYITKPVNPPIVRARVKTHLALRDALEAAKQADRSKDAFLANMSHELRTPLNAVIGMAGLARRLGTDPKQREYLDKIVVSGKYLGRIINDLLDLSKIAAGRMEFETIAFSLAAVLRHCNSVMHDRAAEKGLELIDRVEDAVPDVLRGDPLRIEQILINLIGNAIKFTPSGRVAVNVGAPVREDDRVCLEIAVEDTGIGMSAEELGRLFKAFSQADAAVSRQFGGTGLGLAISKRLAELMGGDISVTSSIGSGSTFRVRLWLEPGDASELPLDEAEQESSQVRYRDARVLVVDDQPFNRDVAEGLLNAVGITPRQAENGRQALDIFTSTAEAFDLVLMDVQMPVMDGLAATREIRQLPGGVQLPIIAMTGQAMAHERERCIAAGMNDHLAKPFDEAGFYQVLAKWIPGRKQCLEASAEPPPLAQILGMPSLRGVDMKAGLALLQGDEARYRHWLNDFVAEAPGAMRQIGQALAAEQPETASLVAHTLKGRMGLLGMNELHNVAAALETAIEGGEPTDELRLDLGRRVATMCEEIQNGLSPANSAEPATTLPK